MKQNSSTSNKGVKQKIVQSFKNSMFYCIIHSLFLFILKIKRFAERHYEKSFFSVVLKKLSKTYTKFTDTSLFVNLFSSYDRSDDRYHKITEKLTAIFNFLTKPFRFLGKVAVSSVFVDKLENIVADSLNISLRSFGLCVLPLGAISLVSSVLKGVGNLETIICLILCVLGGFMILINKSISVIVNESGFCSLLKISLSGNNVIRLNHRVMVVTGIISGIVSVFVGVLPVALMLALIAVISIGLYIPLFWTCVLFAAVLPFMPTMVMVAGSLSLVLCMFLRKITDKYDFEIKGSVLNIYVAFMCFVYVLGVVASVQRFSSLKICLVYIAFILSYFVITKVIDSSKKLMIFISAMAIASIPVSLFGVFQKLTGFDNENTWIDSDMFENISGRVVSFFGNPNVFGEYIILLFMISLALFFIAREKKHKIMYLVITGLLGISMILTYSRGCWIGLVIAVLLFLLLTNRKLLGVVIVLGLVSVLFLPESIIDRVMSIGNLSDTSTSYRVYIWNGTFEMLKDFWLTGIGVGSDAFNTIYPLYAYSQIRAPHPHNLYLLIMSETGIVGILVFMFVVLSLFNKLLHVIKYTANRELKIISSALISSLTGFLVQGMFDNVWYNYRVFLLFWIVVAIGASVYNVHRKESFD